MTVDQHVIPGMLAADSAWRWTFRLVGSGFAFPTAPLCFLLFTAVLVHGWYM